MDDDPPTTRSRRQDIDNYLVLAKWKTMRLLKQIVKIEVQEFADDPKDGSILARFTVLFDKYVDEMN